MFDGIEFRGFEQESVEQLADYAGVPVWNGLTTQWHPTQMLADVMTMTEHFDGRLEDIAYCFLGDGRNNVARSLLVTGALLGMDVRIAAPRELWPPADVLDTAHALAADSGARITVTDDPHAAVLDVDFVYTDVWVSMGESDDEWASRVPILLPYRVTDELMASSGKPHTRFLHCLPSIHNADTDLGQRVRAQFGLDGAEVSDSVFESAASIVFDQAANRMHTIKAVLVNAFDGNAFDRNAFDSNAFDGNAFDSSESKRRTELHHARTCARAVIVVPAVAASSAPASPSAPMVAGLPVDATNRRQPR